MNATATATRGGCNDADNRDCVAHDSRVFANGAEDPPADRPPRLSRTLLGCLGASASPRGRTIRRSRSAILGWRAGRRSAHSRSSRPRWRGGTGSASSALTPPAWRITRWIASGEATSISSFRLSNGRTPPRSSRTSTITTRSQGRRAYDLGGRRSTEAPSRRSLSAWPRSRTPEASRSPPMSAPAGPRSAHAEMPARRRPVDVSVRCRVLSPDPSTALLTREPSHHRRRRGVGSRTVRRASGRGARGDPHSQSGTSTASRSGRGK